MAAHSKEAETMSEKRGDLASSVGLLVLRLGAGGLLLHGHGWTKLMHFNERLHKFANPIGLGPETSFVLVVFAEVVCSILVMLGLFTRLSAIPPIIFFAVAGFIQHAADPWPKRELPFLFGTAYLALLLMGPGRFSLDARLGWKWPFGEGRRG
jgi:putative oxidoreductase